MPGTSYHELTVETTSGSRTLPNTTVRAAERPDPPSPPTAVQADVDGTSATFMDGADNRRRPPHRLLHRDDRPRHRWLYDHDDGMSWKVCNPVCRI